MKYVMLSKKELENNKTKDNKNSKTRIIKDYHNGYVWRMSEDFDALRPILKRIGLEPEYPLNVDKHHHFALFGKEKEFEKPRLVIEFYGKYLIKLACGNELGSHFIPILKQFFTQFKRDIILPDFNCTLDPKHSLAVINEKLYDLNKLRKGMKIKGEIDGSFFYQDLPEGITIDGDLDLVFAPDYTVIPENWTITKNVYINVDDKDKIEIPKSMKIGGKVIYKKSDERLSDYK